MRPARGPALLLLTSILLAVPAAASAAPARQVIMVVQEDRGYHDVLADPALGSLASAGGIGLLTPAGPSGPGAAVAFGAGAPVDGAPRGPVPEAPLGRGTVVDVERYVEEAGEATPGLLGTALAGAGLRVGFVGGRGSDGLLVAMDSGGEIPLAAFGDGPSALDEVMGESDLVVTDAGPESLGSLLEASPAEEVLVMVVQTSPSPEMMRRGGSVTPVVAARGRPSDLLVPGSPPSGLSSDTTGRAGLVSAIDVAPTALDFLGAPRPAEMAGGTIRPEGEEPSRLHDRYLGYRKVVGPVGVAAVLVPLVALVAGAVLLLVPGAPLAATRFVAVAGLFGVAVQVSLLPASWLPRFDPLVVAVVLAGLAGALTMLAFLGGRGSATGPVAVLAAAALALVVADAATGWRSGLTPLIGGSALDGVRFYGLGNSYAGMVLSGAVLAAAMIRPWPGVSLLVAAALFAGMPGLGADFGGGLTLFAVAGAWFGIVVLRRPGWPAAGAALLAAAGGAILLVLSHRYLAGSPTHVSRAVEASSGLWGTFEVFLERLRLNLEVTAATPAVWPALLGLPFWLAVALVPRSPFRSQAASWREAVVVLAAGGMIGYVVNDTYGMASVTFLFVSLAVVYPCLAVRWIKT